MTRLTSDMRITYNLRPNDLLLSHRRLLCGGTVFIYEVSPVPVSGRETDPIQPDEDGSYVIRANQVVTFNLGSINPRGGPAFVGVNPKLFSTAMVSWNSTYITDCEQDVVINVQAIKQTKFHKSDFIAYIYME